MAFHVLVVLALAAGTLSADDASNRQSALPSLLPCDPKYPYRTLDGSCNNLDNPRYGQANTIYQRFIAPATYADAQSGAALPGPAKVICYYTNWSWYRKGEANPADIDLKLCTHILYGFATLDPNKGIMQVFDSWSDTDEYDPNLYAKGLIPALKKHGIKVLIALGGWNDSAGGKYSVMVNNPVSRRRFIENAMIFIENYGFDGLHLYWKYPKCWQVDCNAGPASDKPAFAAFVKELREAFNPKGWLLTAAVSPSKAVLKLIN